MGNNDSKTETKARDSVVGSSVDPVPQPKTVSNEDVSRDVVPQVECKPLLSKTSKTHEEITTENVLKPTKLSSAPLTLEKESIDKVVREKFEVTQDHTRESKADETDGQNANHEEEPSFVSPDLQVLDVLEVDKTTEVHKVLTNKEYAGDCEGLSKNDNLENNNQNISDFERNSATDESRSQESYNSEEVCPIIDDLDFVSDESDNQTSEEDRAYSDKNDVLRKDISDCSDGNKVTQKEVSALSENKEVSKRLAIACSDENEMLNTEASNYSEWLKIENKEEIQKQVTRCLKSMEQLEKDHREILNLVNKRSESQRELNKDGLSIIGELESIVENFTQRRKEKDEAIQHLKTILSKLTENLNVVEQEFHSLQSSRTPIACLGEDKEKSDKTRTESKHPVKPQIVQANDIKQDTPKSENQHGRKTFRLFESNEGPQQGSIGHGRSSEEKDKVDGKINTDSHGIPLTCPETQPQSTLESNKQEKKTCERVLEDYQSENASESRKEKPSDKSVSEGIHQRESAQDNNMIPNIVQSKSEQSSDSGGRQEETNMSSIIGQPNSGQTADSVAKREEEINMNPNIVHSNSKQSSDSVARRQEETNQSNIPNHVPKTNFSISTTKQRETLNQSYWVDKANDILRRNAIEGPADNVCGPNTILCLDTSDSMWGNAFRTMINLALRFLSGVENDPMLSEKVGLVCFGAETKVISRCCLDYPKLKQEIQKLSPGGPSPLTAGLMLSLPLVQGVTIPRSEGIAFYPRIIVITDGVATPELVTSSDDFVPDTTDLLMINSDIKSLVRHFKQRGNRVYCVPVGQANEAIIRPLVEATSGKIVQPANFDKLVHQFHTEIIAAALRTNLPDYRTTDPYTFRAAAEASLNSTRGIDMDDLVEYIKNPPPQHYQDDDDDDDDDASPNEGSSNMPPIGTRVRRGPDWSPEYIGQDGDGPGTVVEHDQGGHIKVMWDNGHLNIYPYGASGRFAVVVVDEPRILQQDQFIEVGCLVRRGDNWRDDDADGGRGNIGVVFRVYSDGTVGVRWPNGRKRRYKYGRQGFFEVEICDPFDEEVRFRMLSMNFQWQESNEEKSTKNKSQVTTKEEPRMEDIVNSDDRKKNNTMTLEEMNQKNALRSNRIEDQLDTDSAPLSMEEGKNPAYVVTAKSQEQCEVLCDASAVQPQPVSAEMSGDLKTDSGPLIQPVYETNSEQEQDISGTADDYIREVEPDKSQLGALHCGMLSTKPSEIGSLSSANDEKNNQDYADKTEEIRKKDTTKSEPMQKQSERLNISRSSSSDMSSNSDTTCGSDASSVAQGVGQESSPSSNIDEIPASLEDSRRGNANADQLPMAPAGVVVWQVHDRYEGWKDFPEEVSNRLEKVFQRNPQGTCSYIKNKKRFQVQLSKMIHIHPVTKEISNVKRIVSH